MTDETELEVDYSFVQYSLTDIDADDLLDLRNDAEMVGTRQLAARIEIERGNVLMYEGYCPQFTHKELTNIGIMLMRARDIHYRAGNDDDIGRIEDISETFLSKLDTESFMEVAE